MSSEFCEQFKRLAVAIETSEDIEMANKIPEIRYDIPNCSTVQWVHFDPECKDALLILWSKHGKNDVDDWVCNEWWKRRITSNSGTMYEYIIPTKPHPLSSR